MGLNIQMSVKRNILLLRLTGELDQYACKKLKTKVVDVINKYCVKYLIINFEYLEFMDSTGIGFMIGRYHDLKRNNGKLIICNMNNVIERIVNLSGLRKICSIAETEEKAYKMLEVA